MKHSSPPDSDLAQPVSPSSVPVAAALTPAMRQYQQIKQQHPDYILFFRMGDFYEMFWEDAQTAHRVLGVTLTSRSRGGLAAEDAIPMAGVPFHSVDGYLQRMITAGYKVALCEQIEDPASAKGVITREVTRLMTPGTLTDDPLLQGRADNYLAAVAFNLTKEDGYRAGLAWVELSTGACVALSGNEGQILDEIARLRPAEILVPEHATGQAHPIKAAIEALSSGAGLTLRPGWQFETHHASQEIRRQWGVSTVAGFGFADDDPAVLATAAILSYLLETQKTQLAHLRPLRRHLVEQYLAIDPASWRSLEIDRTVRAGTVQGSLLSAIDLSCTTMGGRMLRRWLRFPLNDLEHIQARQQAVAALLESAPILTRLRQALEHVCDIERIIARVAVGRCGPRDLAALGKCLQNLPDLLDGLKDLPQAGDVAPQLQALRSFCIEQGRFLGGAITAEPAGHLREGGVIASGFDVELDRLRTISHDSRTWLAEYQTKLAAESGIQAVKVGYNKVFGYYIEVTDAHRAKVPAQWTRKQTLKGSERYITPELKQFENEALSARDRAIALEQALFEQIRQALLPHTATFQELADEVARVDVLAGWRFWPGSGATVSRNWSRGASWRLLMAAIPCWNSSWAASLSPTICTAAPMTPCC